MLHNKPLKLSVANKGDFVVTACISSLLVLLAALLSPQPLLMSIFVILVCVAGWGTYILNFSKVKSEILTLVVFSDGQIRLESNCKDTVGGFLEGQQWCSYQFAILRVSVGDTTSNLLVLSARQKRVDDFRRLNMWLRQGVGIGTRDTGAGYLTRGESGK